MTQMPSGDEFEIWLAIALGEPTYRIKNPEDEYWSGEYGWMKHLNEATIFTANDKARSSLPMHGFWETN